MQCKSAPGLDWTAPAWTTGDAALPLPPGCENIGYGCEGGVPRGVVGIGLSVGLETNEVPGADEPSSWLTPGALRPESAADAAVERPNEDDATVVFVSSDGCSRKPVDPELLAVGGRPD